MRVLVIGGTGFIGRQVVIRLLEQGHDVMVFNRGKTDAVLPNDVIHTTGPREQLLDFRDGFQRFKPDVVLDTIAYTEQDAKTLVNTFRGVSPRVVVLSSHDVYRAYGLLKRLEEGSLEALPCTEHSQLRSKFHPYGGDYEKILVERVVLDAPDISGTVLRLPMVYGPGDTEHRWYWFIKRMADGRSVIPLQAEYVRWRWTRGYVENVADAIVLAVTNESPAERIYNVGDADTISTIEWAALIGNIMGWKGKIVEIPADQLPRNMVRESRLEQDWIVDTSLIRTTLGHKDVVPREEALKRTILWEIQNPPVDVSTEMFDYASEDELLSFINFSLEKQ